MSKRRRSGQSKVKLPKAAEVVGFTAADDAFFRVGEDTAQVAAIPEAPAPARPSFWRRLFS